MNQHQNIDPSIDREQSGTGFTDGLCVTVVWTSRYVKDGYGTRGMFHDVFHDVFVY